MCGPLNLDLDKDNNDQNRKSFEFKEMEISNLKFFKILHVSSNLSKVWRRFEVWRLGEAMCHVTHPGAKWMSPLQQCIADSGPCGSLLVGSADQNWGWILLETVDEIEDLGYDNIRVCPVYFFKK